MNRLITLVMSSKVHGMGEAIEVLTTPAALVQRLRQARDWCQAAVLAVRQAAEPNPWANGTDEAIAGELVRRIEERWKKP